MWPNVVAHAPDHEPVAAAPQIPADEPAPEQAYPDVDEPALGVDHWLQVAREAAEAGRTVEARAALQTAADRFPEAASVHLELARLAEASQDWPEAERCSGVLSPPSIPDPGGPSPTSPTRCASKATWLRRKRW